MSKLGDLWRRGLVTPLRNQLKQGVSPRGLAMSVAWGVVMGIFPILGCTTVICVFLGIAFKLNQPALQSVNYFMYPIQLAMIPVFLSWGAKIFHEPSISFNLKKLAIEFWEGPGVFMQHYGMAGLHAVIVWSFIAPAVGFATFWLTRPVFARWVRGEGRSIGAS